MNRVIIQPTNPCAAAEFMFAVNPFWLNELDIPAHLHSRIFVDVISGKAHKAEVELPDTVELAYTDCTTRPGAYDRNPVLRTTIKRFISPLHWRSPVSAVRSWYPYTGRAVYRQPGKTSLTYIIELELELDGIWASWEDTQRPTCPEFPEEETCTASSSTE